MTQHFKKAGVITDLHLGKRSDSLAHNNDCLNFIKWYVDQAKTAGCDRTIFIGDLFDNRSRLRLDTLHKAIEVVRLLLEVGPVDLIVGNHDMFHRHTREVHSLEIFEDWDGVTVYNDHTVAGNVGFCPYLVGPDYLEVAKMEAKYIFGHFELPLFMLNSMIEMPDRGGMHGDHFHPDTEIIFSGHFHHRQLKINANGTPIQYVGSPFGHDFNDADDPKRGMMILEWDKEPEFIDWADGPLYQRFKASEIIELHENDNLAGMVRPASILEVRDDMGLDLEEIAMVRDAVSELVREVRVYPGATTPGVEAETDVQDIDDKPLVAIVEEHLLGIDPHGSDIQPERLAKIFRGA